MNEELIIGSSEDMLSNATKIQKESSNVDESNLWILLLTLIAFGEFGSKK